MVSVSGAQKTGLAPERLAATTVLITSLAVAVVEWGIGVVAAMGHVSALSALGAGRIAQVFIILAVAQARHGRLTPLGIMPNRIGAALAQGMAWSLVVGLVVMLTTGVLVWFGYRPWRWIQMPMPRQWAHRIVFLGVGGVIGPVAEELFFRGVWYGYLRRWGVLPALIMSNLLFIAAHGAGGGWIQVVGGVLFAIAYERSGQVIVPIVIHVTGNLAIFGLSLTL